MGFWGGLKGAKVEMPMKDEIEQRLLAAFSPDRLEVINESDQHAGHSGDDGTGESHFRIVIRASNWLGEDWIYACV